MTKATITADAIPDAWIALVRETIARGSRELRGPADRPVIELKSNATGQWAPIILYSSVMSFDTIADRDIVLARILAKDPPAPVPTPA